MGDVCYTSSNQPLTSSCQGQQSVVQGYLLRQKT